MQKSFKVFGEPVSILVTGEMSGGRVAVVTQVSPRGGGPPPHVHTREDETFTVLDGEFEIFDGLVWHPLHAGDSYFAERGKAHTFRSVGPKDGTIHVVVSPAGMDEYLEHISRLSIPQDLPELTRISEEFGVSFLPPSNA